MDIENVAKSRKIISGKRYCFMNTTKTAFHNAFHIVCYFSIICFFESCIPKDYIESRFIKIENNSNQDLIFVLSEEGLFKKPFYDEDILILDKSMTDSLSCSDFSWESLIEQTDNKKINIYVVQKSSLEKYHKEIDSVFIKQEYLKKCSFDINYLERNNWRIVFK